MSTDNSDRFGQIFIEVLDPAKPEAPPVSPGSRKRLNPHPTPVSDSNQINYGSLPGAKMSVELVDDLLSWEYTNCVEIAVGDHAFRIYVVPPKRGPDAVDPIRQPTERIRRTWG